MAKKVKEQSVPDQIMGSWELKPEKLITEELSWRFGIRSCLRGDNLMLTGPTGAGKDLFIASLAAALGQEIHYIPFGSTQDPRSSIIGNTHYNPERGTFTQQSYFASVIQKPGVIVAFDELTRAHPEVQNILMTVLDKDKRWLRIDEDPDVPTIQVADGVCFLATANIGAEYLTTRGLDRAFLDRWSILELDYLSKENEIKNLERTFPELDDMDRRLIAEIVTQTRREMDKEQPNLSTALSTRAAEEIGALVADGFTLPEAIKIRAYPLYSKEGNPSERVAFIQMVQAFLPDVSVNDPDIVGPITNDDELKDLF